MKRARRHHGVVFRILFFVLLAGAPGCAVWDEFTSGWDTFTAYFNIYYNASRLYDEAVKEIDKQQAKLGPMSDQPASIMWNIPQKASQNFTKIIEKCSKILDRHKTSSLVDDALLLTGKSYWWLQQYGRAERKFKELMEHFPNSELYAEAQLWLSKSYFGQARDKEARDEFRYTIERALKDEQEEIAAQAYFALGEMEHYLNNDQEAAKAYRDGLSLAGGSESHARTQFQLARLEEILGNKEDAAQAYLRVLDLDPDDDLRLAAELQYARLARETGDIRESMAVLDDMLDNPAYLDKQGEIQIEIAHGLAAQGKIDEAFALYTMIDTTYKNKPEAAEAFYAIGRIYETVYKDLDNAAENYEKSKIAYATSPTARKADKRAKDLQEYRKLRNKIFDTDTLLFYVMNPDSLAVRDSLQALADSLEREKRLKEGPSEDELMARRKQMARSRRRPHGRNTGITSIDEPTKTVAAGNLNLTRQQVYKKAEQPAYRRLDLSKVPLDSLRHALALLRFDMGGIMYNKVGMLDSARHYFFLAMKDSLGTSRRAQGYYFLAQIDRDLGKEDEAVAREDELLRRFPDSPYARQVLKDRNLPVPPDSAEVIRKEYDLAAAYLERGEYERGIEELKKFIERFPMSEECARAHLAIGLTCELDLRDSARALAAYRTLIAKYPKSPCTERAKKVVEIIRKVQLKQGLYAEQKAFRDSIIQQYISGVIADPPMDYINDPRVLEHLKKTDPDRYKDIMRELEEKRRMRQEGAPGERPPGDFPPGDVPPGGMPPGEMPPGGDPGTPPGLREDQPPSEPGGGEPGPERRPGEPGACIPAFLDGYGLTV